MLIEDINKSIITPNLLNKINWDEEFGRKLNFIGTDEEKISWFQDENGNPVSISGTIDIMQAEKINPNLKQVIFFFGLSSIEEIVLAVEKANKESIFIFIEPNSLFLKKTIENEELSFLKNVNFHVISCPMEDFEVTLKGLMITSIISKIKNLVFYFNSYFRKEELSFLRDSISLIRKVIQDSCFRLGNDIHDSLMGLVNNMKNISVLNRTPDVGWMKNRFKNIPIFIVAAGPSLDKNICELKRIGNKGIIIAVDTIAEKLVKYGVKPHFIASVERFLVWEYFFKDKPVYYKDSYLVAPLLAQPEVVNLFQEKAVYPLRDSTCEYHWLKEICGLTDDYEIWMGGSCAHVAMGFAVHLGGAPIVLVGQDLAYGSDITKTHAAGTEYDNSPEAEPEKVYTVDGYYGEPVKTQEIWNNFRSLYEDIIRTRQLRVINATEGGAKIKGTEQSSLAEVINEYCINETYFEEIVTRAPKTKIDLSNIELKLKEQIKSLEKNSRGALEHYKKLKGIEEHWDEYYNSYKINKIFSTLKKTDKYFRILPKNKLIYHNLQGPAMVIMQKFHNIPDDGTEESLKRNLELQLEFCGMYTNTVWMIAQVIRENFPWSQKEEKKC